MSTVTITEKKKSDDSSEPGRSLFSPRWQTALTYAIGLVLLLLGLYLRLHDLGLPFDRDGYDEGVYWQSLRAMAAGYPLYKSIFYSQPPAFLLLTYPFYMLFGQSLWSARLGIVIVSLSGLVGAFLLGRAISGRLGALAGLLLMVADPFYLSQSQKIQAEAPSAGFSLLAVGLAYLWWENPEGAAGLWLGALCGITASLSILSKLLGVTILVPIGLLMLAQFWRIFRQPRQRRLRYATSLIVGVVAFLLTTAVFVLPYLVGSFHQFWAGVVTFHTTAGVKFKATLVNNFPMMVNLLTSITAFTALVSTIIALLRRDWRVLPLLAWLGATILVLLDQDPLFHHHLVALIPPMVALAVVGIAPLRLERARGAILRNVGTAITLVMIITALTLNFQGEQAYFQGALIEANSAPIQQTLQVAQTLDQYTKPGQLVITDAQFIAALANRSTPPSLVDTSLVRINTHYLTLQQLIQAASDPRVHAVLFYTYRLTIKSVTPFHQWLATHGFHLVKGYKPGQELWVRQ